MRLRAALRACATSQAVHSALMATSSQGRSVPIADRLSRDARNALTVIHAQSVRVPSSILVRMVHVFAILREILSSLT